MAEGASADAVNCRNADTLARLHPFPNDPNLLFDEASHTYTIFGAVPQRSCTSLIAAFFAGFHPQAITDKYLERWRDDPSSTYYPQIQSVLEGGGSEADAAKCIRDEWAERGSEASRLGTELHRYCEFELNGTPVASPPELEAEVEQYHAWRQSPVVLEYQLKPIRTELTVAWRVGERVVCAGQIDALFADKYGYYYVRVCRGCNRNPCVLYAHAARRWSLLGQMVDFKRTKKSIDANASAFGRTGAGPVSHVPDTAFYKYSLQQSMYELMLEQTHGLRCEGGLYLLRMHAEIETYEMVQCADMKAEAKALLDHEHARLLAERAAAAVEVSAMAPSEVEGAASGKRRRPGEEQSGEGYRCSAYARVRRGAAAVGRRGRLRAFMSKKAY